MTELFGEKTIKSISFDQHEIIRDIITLYCPDGIECDVTYSTGQFYKNIDKPKYKFDINPTGPEITKSCVTQLPLESKSIKSVMFDPPFIVSWNIKSYNYKMTTRFGGFKGMNELEIMYKGAIIELSRVIKKKGILIVKCQDIVSGGKNYFNHILVHDFATQNGFKAIDLFVLLSKQRFTGPHVQKHNRKYHSYFWVFKKQI